MSWGGRTGKAISSFNKSPKRCEEERVQNKVEFHVPSKTTMPCLLSKPRLHIVRTFRYVAFVTMRNDFDLSECVGSRGDWVYRRARSRERSRDCVNASHAIFILATRDFVLHLLSFCLGKERLHALSASNRTSHEGLTAVQPTYLLLVIGQRSPLLGS
jgi:hypothetical protein